MRNWGVKGRRRAGITMQSSMFSDILRSTEHHDVLKTNKQKAGEVLVF